MNELTKIKNVMKKVVPDAPDEVLLVLDGSTGQNAFEQAKQFTLATEVTAMAITKLDGTAKGGVVIGISDQFKIPVKYIGLGEGMEDLQVFRKNAFCPVEPSSTNKTSSGASGTTFFITLLVRPLPITQMWLLLIQPVVCTIR